MVFKVVTGVLVETLVLILPYVGDRGGGDDGSSENCGVDGDEA